MKHSLVVFEDPDSVATAGAQRIADLARRRVAETGRFRWAVSGGKTPWSMFERLASEEMPWSYTDVFQVDERVAPAGNNSRNSTHLERILNRSGAHFVPMEVEAADLDAAAASYAKLLPLSFDLIHLGLGADGHTASLIPQDSVLAEVDRLVAPTQHPYQGFRRLTLTFPAIARTNQLMWIVTGESKRFALARLLTEDPAIPASQVRAPASLILADLDATGRNNTAVDNLSGW